MQNKGEEKIKKVLFNEVSLVIAIIGFTLGVVGYISNPQQKLEKEIIIMQTQIEARETLQAQLQNIKDNDLKEVHLSQTRVEDNQRIIQNDLVELKTLLSQHMQDNKK